MNKPLDSPVSFATKLMELIREGRTTTSYKYALLLALIDLCQESVGRHGGPTGSVTTRQVARRVVEIYWQQTRIHGKTGRVLRQFNRQQRSILDIILAFRDQIGLLANATVHKAFAKNPDLFENMLDEIEGILIRYPIPLLQQLGQETLRLVYEITWKQQPRPGPVKAYQKALRSHGPKENRVSFDNVIRFLPGVEEHLAELADLLRPIIRHEWSRFVTHCNELDYEDIEEFLFYPTRKGLSPVRRPLLEFQVGRCFYCNNPIVSTADVDHFLPWSRCGDDQLYNLVVSHPKCNNSKSDHLAATMHLQTWSQRLETQNRYIQNLGQNLSWPADSDRSLRLARSLYLRVEDGAPLWLSPDRFEIAEPEHLRYLLRAV